MNGNFMLFFLVAFPIVAAVVSYLIGRRSKALRDLFAMIAGVAELAVMITLAITTLGQTVSFRWDGFCALGIRLVLDDFRRIYGLVAAFMWAMTLLFSKEYFAHYRNRNRYYLFNLLTLGATMGVFLSVDLYTTFIFFEVMSFTSYVWVAHEETPGAMRAANTYLAVAVIGGLVALMGLFLLQHNLGTLAIDELYAAAQSCTNKGVLYVAGSCLLVGFGAKAGMFPLHIWLPKAHPVAPAPASALLSGILTKSGVYGLLAVSCNIFRYDHDWGMLILILGTVTMVLGAVLAVFSVDLKRTLACSSMSQIGFIAVGIGMMGLLGEENALAARGVVLHMVNHSLIKLCLFMLAGVVYMNLHQLDLNAIRGFGRKKPFLHFCYLMGALGIGGIPLWNGYVSKTLLHESIVEFAHHLAAHGYAAGWVTAVEWLFLISGGLTLAYMTKLYIAIFVEKHPSRQAEFDAKKDYISPLSRVALGLSAIVLPILGMTPTLSMDRLADGASEFLAAHLPAHAVHYFSFVNLKGAIISVAIGAAVYLVFIRLVLRKKDGTYRNCWPAKLDLEDGVYRPLCDGILAVLGLVFAGICALPDAAVALVRNVVFKPSEEPDPDLMHRSFSYRMGAWLDRRFPRGDDREPRSESFVRTRQTIRRTTMGIAGNLSFALLMCCVGICLLLLYLVFVYG